MFITFNSVGGAFKFLAFASVWKLLPFAEMGKNGGETDLKWKVRPQINVPVRHPRGAVKSSLTQEMTPAMHNITETVIFQNILETSSGIDFRVT